MTSTVSPTPPAPPSGPEPSRLRRWIILGALIVGASALIPLALPFLPAGSDEDDPGILALPIRARASGPPGRIVVTDALTYDFGKMAQFDEGTKSWLVKNEGQGDVVMRLGPKDCSCTVANFEDHKESAVLKAGGSTEITLKWKTKGSDVGEFIKGAIIYLDNDADRQELKFTIKGEVQPAIVTMPAEPTLDFASIANDEPHQAYLALHSPDRPDLKITAIRSSDPERVEATFEPLNADEKKHLGFADGYKIIVKVPPNKTLGVFSQIVTIETDHPKKKELKIEVGGRLVGPVTVSPSMVRLAGVPSRSGASTTAILLVRGQDQTHFEVENTPGGLKATIEPVDDKTGTAGTAVKLRQYRMTVTVPPGTEPGLIEGSIALRSDHPRVAELTIPVNITVQGAD